jgi:hypothetical protein
MEEVSQLALVADFAAALLVSGRLFIGTAAKNLRWAWRYHGDLACGEKGAAFSHYAVAFECKIHNPKL